MRRHLCATGARSTLDLPKQSGLGFQREDEVRRLDGSYRIRADSSTDERWLLLVLGPGFLGGSLLRLLLKQSFAIVAVWMIVWLLIASAGTIWYWARDRKAHLRFLAFYGVVAIIVIVLAIVVRR